MIHISELAWNRVSHPEDVVSVGQSLKCKVLRLDLEKDRIDLSLKVAAFCACRLHVDRVGVTDCETPMLSTVHCKCAQLFALLQAPLMLLHMRRQCCRRSTVRVRLRGTTCEVMLPISALHQRCLLAAPSLHA